ncbi:MAG: glycosyl hydrolase 115 family protein [Prevotella sp.]|nr:glycosyl hydrolase 115 family protein [Prevotella sp.]MBO6191217.1 glycosyl hydrolase 115 family protein [Prevotella sp.]
MTTPHSHYYLRHSMLLLTLLWMTCQLQANQVLRVNSQQGSFPLFAQGRAASICVSANEPSVVRKAASLLADDVERVTNSRPQLSNRFGRHDIIVATIGHNPNVDRLIQKYHIDITSIRDRWECFLLKVIDHRLLILGSDPRGTAYGVFTLSEALGVSPWYWWADVPVVQRQTVYIDADYISSTPSVKYRGIFINDEDWSLKPWASNHFEKTLGDIGPRTYAKVCELLLRLKANMLAPAMHSCTGAFYSHAESKMVCDSFGIIVTTSHCEPLLLNNAAESEWNQKRDGDWNYKTNRQTILKKWDDRLTEASRYENIYTVAMRGVHDAGLRGDLSMRERVSLLDTVILNQRQLLEKHLHRPAAAIPQIFVPYKETMDIYENGLQVPEDITLVWVDDNYGYMKRVSTPEEQRRTGRSGVYYHLSYLGTPHDYLWLNTTPPVLMYEELKKAYDTGSDRYWLLNVGDIKPMELGIQTFMDMAWNFPAFDIESVNRHQSQWLNGLFPTIPSDQLQSLLDTYYQLAWSRKPEYMGWEYEWDEPWRTRLRPTEFSFQHYGEAQQRLADYQHISDEAERLSDGTAAYFELVQYPVQAACQMNRKFLMAQLNQELHAQQRYAEANWAARQMEAAYDSINTLNNRYNSQGNGKWQGFMAVPEGFCALYHQKPDVAYTEGAGERPYNLQTSHSTLPQNCYTIPLEHFRYKTDGIKLIRGVGYDWQVVQLNSGEVSYDFPAVDRDTIDVTLTTLPFWPLYAGKSNRLGISVDGSLIQVFENHFKEWGPRWKEQVLRNGAVCHLRFAVDQHQPSHAITFHCMDAGQMLQRVIIDWGGLQPSYLGPNPNKKYNRK